MNIWDSLGGMVELELTSAEPERALEAIAAQGVELFNVTGQGQLTYSLTLRRRDHKTVAALCEKRGDTILVKKRKGLYWSGRNLLKRPVLLLGTALLLGLVLYLPSRVLFVQVEGNAQVPARRILEAAEDSGIRFGASRRAVRSEKVKNSLLSAVPELQWAGVNTAGCTATISVRERAQGKKEPEAHGVSSLVASRDGFILSGTVTRGNPLFQVGGSVKEGQVLVSGYTDCGLCIRAERAEGEIMAQTRRDLEAVTPLQGLQRREETGVQKKYSLLLGKKRINLWKGSRNLSPSCGRMYEEYYVTLPGGFRLPLALCVDVVTSCHLDAYELPRELAGEVLGDFSQRYLTGQMVAGTILSRDEQVRLRDGVYVLTGKYVCSEMISRERREQIGE